MFRKKQKTELITYLTVHKTTYISDVLRFFFLLLNIMISFLQHVLEIFNLILVTIVQTRMASLAPGLTFKGPYHKIHWGRGFRCPGKHTRCSRAHATYGNNDVKMMRCNIARSVGRPEYTYSRRRRRVVGDLSARVAADRYRRAEMILSVRAAFAFNHDLDNKSLL